jgi:7-carboxy-7-deazaguanine synthase
MVKEIFGPTIQGEGSEAGTVVHFVRFAGCNMWDGRPETKAKSRCPFCDTDFRGGTRMTAQEICDALAALSPVKHQVVLSGGEPGLQVDDNLVLTLFNSGHALHIETNGSRKIPFGIKHVTISPKVSREEVVQRFATDLKLLYPPIRPELTPEAFEGFPAQNFLLQPVMDDNYQANLQATLEKLKTLKGWRLSLQTHKILGVP